MIQPFIWMFKHKDFKEHFRYFVRVLLMFFISNIILTFFLLTGHQIIAKHIQLILIIVSFFLYAAPFLCLQGYMWELTGNIISRDWDIVANSVYNGKIKQVYKIEFPETKTLRLIWRGIASVVANILMAIPLILLLLISGVLGVLGCKIFNTSVFANPAYPFALIGAVLMYWFLIPAFLWNYAHRDSVVAVWNLRKAVYIAGNYTGKYILNSTIFCIFNFVVSFLVQVLFILGQISPTIPFIFVILHTVGVISYFIYIYCIYVDAYLLGTIAPPHEG